MYGMTAHRTGLICIYWNVSVVARSYSRCRSMSGMTAHLAHRSPTFEIPIWSHLSKPEQLCSVQSVSESQSSVAWVILACHPRFQCTWCQSVTVWFVGPVIL